VTTSRQNAWRYLGRDHPARAFVDIGGPFRTIRVSVTPDSGEPYLLDSAGSGLPRNQYDGILFPDLVFSRLLNVDNMVREPVQRDLWFQQEVPGILSDLDLYALGATAVSRVQPTSPVVDGATSVAELLREGLPSIPGTQHNPGSEYLNYQFGIAPTLDFFKDAMKAARTADKVLQKLERDSGKLVRRRYDFDEERNTTSSTVSGVRPYFGDGSVPNVYVSKQGTLSKVIKIRKRIWFSGAFTYHFPDTGWRKKLAEWDRIYGTTPGVDSLYNLVPWSWLVDYFSNTGDLLSNLNAFAFDGLVMPYGYVMCTQETTESYTWQGELFSNGAWRREIISGTIERVSKRRVPATPWGFGLTADLTDRQIMILAALGLSRV